MAKSACAKRAADRKASKKYAAKNKEKHKASVKKSESKPTTKAGKAKAVTAKAKAALKSGDQAAWKKLHAAAMANEPKGKGKHGHKIGRPRKPC